jgi:hypothetical protein
LAVAAHLGGSAATQADSAFVDGLRIAFLTAGGAAVIAAIAVFVLLPRHER